jgi:hypothetical protein
MVRPRSSKFVIGQVSAVDWVGTVVHDPDVWPGLSLNGGMGLGGLVKSDKYLT